MTNKEIAKAFQYLGQIMELHGENPYKVRSYQNAYLTLRKLDKPLAEMTDEEIGAIKGVGKAISSKIRELLNSGQLSTLQKYEDQTPEGVRELLRIPGIGPKKIRTVWKDLDVESVGELLYAVQENRLLELKGFGEKTQADLKKKLEYYLRSKNRFRYASLDRPGRELLENLERKGIEGAETGVYRRRCNVLPAIELLVRAEQADRLRNRFRGRAG
jgi:DNA polymerase (family 10)